MGQLVYFPARPLQDHLLTKADLCERWSVSARWIELRVKHDGLPMQKDPRSRLVWFSLVAVERWRQERIAS
jgi:hypothetical protein